MLKPIEVTAARPRSSLPPVELSTEVTATVVQRPQSANAYDLIRRSAGIEVHEQGQGPGWASDVVIRGFTSDHSSDVLLILDGVPINLPIHGHVEGYSDWTILSPAAVQRLRVIHGPASPLYGNFAVGGVVEVTTIPDATGPTASLGGSSYGDAAGWFRGGAHHGDSGAISSRSRANATRVGETTATAGWATCSCAAGAGSTIEPASKVVSRPTDRSGTHPVS